MFLCKDLFLSKRIPFSLKAKHFSLLLLLLVLGNSSFNVSELLFMKMS